MRPADAGRLLLLGSIWGSSFVLIKLGLEGLTPIGIVALRVAIGTAVLMVLMRTRKAVLATGVWRHLAVMAVVSNAIPFALIGWGELHITSSLAAIENSTTPLWTVLIAGLLLADEKLKPLRLAGVVLGFAGVSVIVGVETGGGLGGHIAVLAAAASYAIGFVYAKRHLTGRGASALQLSAGQLLIATLYSVPVAGIEAIVVEPSFEPAALLAVAALGIFGTGLAYVLYYRLVHDLGPTTASFVTYLIPIFGVLLGWLVLEEPIGINTLIGGLMVLGGIALAEHAVRRAAPVAEAVVRAEG